MKASKSFFNFAIAFCIGLTACLFSACKGRTMENMEPKGNTVEVVIVQDTTLNNNNNNL